MKSIIVRDEDGLVATAEVVCAGQHRKITAEVSDEWWSEYTEVSARFEEFQLDLYDMLDEDMNRSKHE